MCMNWRAKGVTLCASIDEQKVPSHLIFNGSMGLKGQIAKEIKTKRVSQMICSLLCTVQERGPGWMKWRSYLIGLIAFGKRDPAYLILDKYILHSIVRMLILTCDTEVYSISGWHTTKLQMLDVSG